MRVQVSQVDLDGRKIDFRLMREGEELTARAMKDKGASTGGVPAKASTKRSRSKAEAPSERGERAERSDRSERVEHVAAAAPQSAMQAFRTAVKKAANKMKGRKPRR